MNKLKLAIEAKQLLETAAELLFQARNKLDRFHPIRAKEAHATLRMTDEIRLQMDVVVNDVLRDIEAGLSRKSEGQ